MNATKRKPRAAATAQGLYLVSTEHGSKDMNNLSTAEQQQPVDILELQDRVSLGLYEATGLLGALAGEEFNNYRAMDAQSVQACLFILSTKLNDLQQLVDGPTWPRPCHSRTSQPSC